ncbi:hypothetical protein [Nostoc sp. CCY0012]|uniref:hypothetical protein n=1 Tax=Nostoc sp. CCY0012 TaxID=1056123 RepID=UPI0039C5D3A0
MKDKQNHLKDIDLFTELTLSEQEQINGGIGGLVTPPPPPPPPPPVSSFAPQWPGR